MFIDTQANPKNRAPEERNVVSDDSHQQHFAPPELRKLYALAYYKHFVPPMLETFQVSSRSDHNQCAQRLIVT